MNKAEKNTKSTENKALGAEIDDFFIPDLCNTRSVLTLVLASELFALVVVIVSNPLPNFNWLAMAKVSLLTQWVTLSSAGIVCGLRPWLRAMHPMIALVVCLLVVMIDTAVFSLVGEWALTPEFLAESVWYNIDYWSVAQSLLISALIGGMVFRYFLVQHRLRQKERAELNARLQSLQSRIRPHFLFNSMNIIASLIAVDPDKAESVVEDLAELFRASLKETANVVPLNDEIELCRKYAGIEQLRLGDRLEVQWLELGFDEQTYQQVEIPMLLLQPLLENAIYHGIQPRPEGGLVEIVLDNEGDLFKIQMTNPLPAATYHSGSNNKEPKHHKGNQMAIKNIRHRLEAIYQGEGILVQDQIDEKFVTVLSFPKSTLGYDQG